MQNRACASRCAYGGRNARRDPLAGRRAAGPAPWSSSYLAGMVDERCELSAERRGVRGTQIDLLRNRYGAGRVQLADLVGRWTRCDGFGSAPVSLRCSWWPAARAARGTRRLNGRSPAARSFRVCSAMPAGSRTGGTSPESAAGRCRSAGVTLPARGRPARRSCWCRSPRPAPGPAGRTPCTAAGLAGAEGVPEVPSAPAQHRYQLAGQGRVDRFRRKSLSRLVTRPNGAVG
jgi:hypothetical protein